MTSYTLKSAMVPGNMQSWWWRDKDSMPGRLELGTSISSQPFMYLYGKCDVIASELIRYELYQGFGFTKCG